MANENKVRTTIRLDPELIRAARIYAAQTDLRTFQAVVEEALRRLLKKGAR